MAPAHACHTLLSGSLFLWVASPPVPLALSDLRVCTVHGAGGVLTEADIDALLSDIEQQVIAEIQAELAELERLEQEQQQHAASMVEQHMQLHNGANGALTGRHAAVQLVAAQLPKQHHCRSCRTPHASRQLPGGQRSMPLSDSQSFCRPVICSSCSTRLVVAHNCLSSTIVLV